MIVILIKNMTITRNTRQRNILQETTETFKEFFTAEQLFEKAKRHDSKISLATTYRYLNQQQKQGTLHAFICNKKSIYSKDKTSHAHYVCQGCQKVTHFSLKDFKIPGEILPGNICHFQLNIHGVCNKCKK